MIRIEVNQGYNKVESVHVDKNDFGVISVLINYEKRWCEWSTGSGSDDEDNRYQSFYIYDTETDEAGEPYTVYGNTTEINLWHDGELDGLFQKTSQCKDQLHVLFMPYEIVEDGEELASWESPEWKAFRQRDNADILDEDLFNV